MHLRFIKTKLIDRAAESGIINLLKSEPANHDHRRILVNDLPRILKRIRLIFEILFQMLGVDLR